MKEIGFWWFAPGLGLVVDIASVFGIGDIPPGILLSAGLAVVLWRSYEVYDRLANRSPVVKSGKGEDPAVVRARFQEVMDKRIWAGHRLRTMVGNREPRRKIQSAIQTWLIDTSNMVRLYDRRLGAVVFSDQDFYLLFNELETEEDFGRFLESIEERWFLLKETWTPPE